MRAIMHPQEDISHHEISNEIGTVTHAAEKGQVATDKYDDGCP